MSTDTTTTDCPDTAPADDDLLYWAWTIIANAGHNRGGWDEQDHEWVAAAKRWRDAFHATLHVEALAVGASGEGER